MYCPYYNTFNRFTASIIPEINHLTLMNPWISRLQGFLTVVWNRNRDYSLGLSSSLVVFLWKPLHFVNGCFLLDMDIPWNYIRSSLWIGYHNVSSEGWRRVGMRRSHISECYDHSLMVCDTIIVRWIGTVSEECLYSENACSSFQRNTGNEQMDLMVLNFRNL
jgi:hypothetical protein